MIEIKKHKIYFIYPFYFDNEIKDEVYTNKIMPLKRLQIKDVYEQLYLSEELKNQIDKNPENKEILFWEEKGLNLNPNLYGHLKNLFGQSKVNIENHASKKKCTEPFFSNATLQQSKNSNLKTFLQGSWGGGTGTGMEFKLSSSAATRLGLKENNQSQSKKYWLAFKIVNVSVQFFGTGIGTVNIEIEILPDHSGIISSECIIEGANALGRLDINVAKIRWKGMQDEDDEDDEDD
jgi:hypothetical protein